MNGTHLSKRLQTVSEHVEPGSRLADIGSDHAYLPVYLAANQIISYGVVGEVARGPLANATSEIQRAGLAEILHPRLADGLAAIKDGDDIDAITIAGMGGILITHILETGKQKLTGKEKLILQPNVGANVVRQWLMDNRYQLSAEQILEEEGHIYEILTAKKVAAPVSYTEKQLRFGPYLLAEKTPAFVAKWTSERSQLQRIIDNMKLATSPDQEKIERIERDIQMINEVIHVES